MALSQEEFIKRAEKKHGQLYDYNKSIYTGIHKKLIIICPEHGEFIQTANDHLHGNACPKCGRSKISQSRSLTLSKFIKKSLVVHAIKYDYSKVIIINSYSKVIIRCLIHGTFSQTPALHMRGRGCPACGILKQKKELLLTTQEFIDKSNKVHNYTYKYPDIYKRSSLKINIICPEHGLFSMRPNDHLNGQGCNICHRGGFKLDEQATLYYIFDPESNMYKIGITNNNIDQRFGKKFLDNRKVKVLQETSFENGADAYIAEQEILEAFSYARCVNDTWPQAKGGKTEFFNRDILKLNIKEA